MIKKVVLCLICVICLLLIGCTSGEKETKGRIRQLASIEIPDDSSMIYNWQERHYLTGIRPQYTVFCFQEEPVDFLAEYGFQSGREESFEHDFNREFKADMARLPEDKVVPTEYMVDWEEDYMYVKGKPEHVLFVYIPNQHLLVVFICGR